MTSINNVWQCLTLTSYRALSLSFFAGASNWRTAPLQVERLGRPALWRKLAKDILPNDDSLSITKWRLSHPWFRSLAGLGQNHAPFYAPLLWRFLVHKGLWARAGGKEGINYVDRTITCFTCRPTPSNPWHSPILMTAITAMSTLLC